eukprot:1416158-Rhodomonas_salina.1
MGAERGRHGGSLLGAEGLREELTRGLVHVTRGLVHVTPGLVHVTPGLVHVLRRGSKLLRAR